MNGFFASWLRAIQKNPAAFNSLTGCGLCLSSDLVAQYLENDSNYRRSESTTNSTSSIDTTTITFRIRRAVSAGAIGAFFGGLVYPAAYARIDAMWKGTHVAAVVQKSVFEIATVGIFVNSVSMTSRGLLVGRTAGDVKTHLIEEMPTVTFNDAKVWLPYNFLAFMWIPAPIRPTTTLLMEAGWQTYISLMSNNYDDHRHSQESHSILIEEHGGELNYLNRHSEYVLATSTSTANAQTK